MTDASAPARSRGCLDAIDFVLTLGVGIRMLSRQLCKTGENGQAFRRGAYTQNGRNRTARTVETVQRFRLMAYTRFGPPNSDFGSIRTGGVRPAVSWKPRRHVASFIGDCELQRRRATCRGGDYPCARSPRSCGWMPRDSAIGRSRRASASARRRFKATWSVRSEPA